MFIHLGTASGALTPTYRAVKARIWPCFRQVNSARKSTAIVALRNTSLLLETTTYRTLAESICPQKDLNWREQWDNRPTSVYANNCKSPDPVQVRGVLYYSSAGFFLLQLEQACSVLPPSVVPVTNAGVPAGKDGNRVERIGHRIHEPMVDRSAPRPAEVGILIGRIRSLVVKNMDDRH